MRAQTVVTAPQLSMLSMRIEVFSGSFCTRSPLDCSCIEWWWWLWWCLYICNLDILSYFKAIIFVPLSYMFGKQKIPTFFLFQSHSQIHKHIAFDFFFMAHRKFYTRPSRASFFSFKTYKCNVYLLTGTTSIGMSCVVLCNSVQFMSSFRKNHLISRWNR